MARFIFRRVPSGELVEYMNENLLYIALHFPPCRSR